MKKLLLASVGALLGASFAGATTVFQFNEAFSGGISSNLSNAAGESATNGLFYGIIVYTAGSSSTTTTYDPIVPALSSTLALTSNGVATGAVVIFASDLTADQSFGGAFTDSGGVTGTAGGVSGVTVTYNNGIASGQSFQLIWFDTNLQTAGVLSSSEFLIPADTGAALTVDDIFIGEDVVRAATGLSFGVIPEPSTALLGAIGALGLLRRRRN